VVLSKQPHPSVIPEGVRIAHVASQHVDRLVPAHVILNSEAPRAAADVRKPKPQLLPIIHILGSYTRPLVALSATGLGSLEVGPAEMGKEAVVRSSHFHAT
jgi:hypothetical protein